ncbi:hypothetical protein [Deinococcus multiflagellatus]|nr:hypothetical protein [Deinococcus multiflagellatus]MBZ9715022.1 hypothetical protein [Deinococcus multiflagellatus]
MSGEPLGDPTAVSITAQLTCLDFSFDSTNCHRSSMGIDEALRLAAQYVQSGTPVRTTNRAGPQTAGTRLIEGIGPGQLDVQVDVPDEVEQSPDTGESPLDGSQAEAADPRADEEAALNALRVAAQALGGAEEAARAARARYNAAAQAYAQVVQQEGNTLRGRSATLLQ